MTQAALAAQVGVSASYMNLIEWNKRPIAGALLMRIAEALSLSLSALESVSEKRLQEALTEIGHLPALSGLGLETDRASELIGRFPGWSRSIAALARAEREASDKVRVLSERMSNDPFLGETVHRMLTRIASIRSAVEILTDYSDLSAAQRDRFNAIVRDESRALTEVGEALTVYLDKAEEFEGVLTPLDEVESLFETRQNHFAEIEMATAGLTDRLTDPRPVSRYRRAKELVDAELSGVIDGIIAEHQGIETETARRRARQALSEYAIGAVQMPMASFAGQARDLGYDIEALTDEFACQVDAVCRRLTALPRDSETPRFGYFLANAAGTMIEMLGLEGLSIPRYAAACPLWVLYRAQQSPETVIRQRALFPSGARFVFVAQARHQGATGFGKPRHYVTDMIALSEIDAQRTVYAPAPTTPVEEVGPSCRLCPRTACPHRVEDPLAD